MTKSSAHLPVGIALFLLLVVGASCVIVTAIWPWYHIFPQENKIGIKQEQLKAIFWECETDLLGQNNNCVKTITINCETYSTDSRIVSGCNQQRIAGLFLIMALISSALSILFFILTAIMLIFTRFSRKLPTAFFFLTLLTTLGAAISSSVVTGIMAKVINIGRDVVAGLSNSLLTVSLELKPSQPTSIAADVILFVVSLGLPLWYRLAFSAAAEHDAEVEDAEEAKRNKK
ncbi:hypothetical protein HDU76_002420 [Blyttiomyces sp. JEL0837]|nr:hypothetical protein HDU76_002420 [Blyttiomyces sp. JEL0837]